MKLPSAFIIGDSISIGYDPYLKKYLNGKFRYSRKQGAKEANWNLDMPMCANGGDSSLVLKYLRGNHIHKEIPNVDYFLFNCGLHDIRTGTVLKRKQIPLLSYRINLCLIIQEINKFANHIIWINSTPIEDARHNSLCKDFFRYNDDVLLYNNEARIIMQKFNIPIIDLYSFTLLCGQNPYSDHVHFKETIYQKQSKFIARCLIEQHYSKATL